LLNAGISDFDFKTKTSVNFYRKRQFWPHKRGVIVLLTHPASQRRRRACWMCHIRQAEGAAALAGGDVAQGIVGARSGRGAGP
jgi:hypothetical protein